MVEQRPRRRSRAAEVKEELGEQPAESGSRTPSSRRRSRPSGGVKDEAVSGAEDRVQDTVIEEGNGEAVAEQKEMPPPKRPMKRKRDYAATKAGVHGLEAFTFYQELVTNLISNPECEDFLMPVLELWTDDQVPFYRERIKQPMDLGTIKDKLRDDAYVVQDKVNEFHFDTEACGRDLRLVFENCMDYNDPDSGLHAIAKSLLDNLNKHISERERRVNQEIESALKKAKRDSERRRRKKAEEVAAAAAEGAKRAQLQLEKLKREAEEAERKRQLELKKKEAEWQQRMEAEKQAAVAAAVQEALAKQRKEVPRSARLVNTSSISSDEHEQGTGEVTFAFVSTAGMEKKRGRKSGLVMELESRHEELMKRRKAMVDASVELEKLKQLEMTYNEKRKVCEEVAELDFVRMKAVVDIIARGMNRPDILNEVEIDLDIDHIDNVVLREVQYFLQNPVAATAKDALRKVEADITNIESRLVSIRYQKVGH